MAKLFVVSAPSGAGKNTLIRYALSHVPDLVYSISATTRKPRPGEMEGREYFFKTPEEFKRMMEAGELAEHQEVYGGVFYGTPRQFILDSLKAGKSVILDIDVFGRTRLEKDFPDAVTIFIDVPNPGVLLERLQKRKADSTEQIEERVRKAQKEIAYSRGKYQHRVINADRAAASREFTGIIRKELGLDG